MENKKENREEIIICWNQVTGIIKKVIQGKHTILIRMIDDEYGLIYNTEKDKNLEFDRIKRMMELSWDAHRDMEKINIRADKIEY